jgi:hypothetical protein
LLIIHLHVIFKTKIGVLNIYLKIRRT